MINSKKRYKEYINLEEKLYREIGYKGQLHAFVTQCEVGKLFHYIVALRKDEYYSNMEQKSILQKILFLYYRRKHNLLGSKLGISIPVNTFKEGLLIYHSQGIIVHRDSRCGKYCKLHGLNCIGNNGVGGGENNSPHIGNYLDLGVGGKIIGNVTLADHITVAANAVVCRSFSQEGSVLAGIPAANIKN